MVNECGPILVTLMKKALCSSETSVLTRATRLTSQKTPFFNVGQFVEFRQHSSSVNIVTGVRVPNFVVDGAVRTCQSLTHKAMLREVKRVIIRPRNIKRKR
jgi:hypothetical protein